MGAVGGFSLLASSGAGIFSLGSGDGEGDSDDRLPATPPWPLLLLRLLPAMSLAKKGSVV